MEMESIAEIEQLIASPEKTEAELAGLWNRLSTLYADSAPDTALDAAEKALEFAIKSGDNASIAEAYENKGIQSIKKGDNLNGLYHYSEALKVWEHLREAPRVLILLKRMGNIYLRSGNYPQAIELYKQAIEQLKADGDMKGMADISTNLGITYGYQGKYAPALTSHYEALHIYEEQNNIERLCRSLLNIGSIYSGQANHSEALKIFMRALQHSEEKDYKDVSAKLYGNIGNTFRNQGNLLKAIEYQTKGLKVIEEIGDTTGLAQSLYSRGDIYGAQGDEQKALDYYQRSLTIREEVRDKKGIVECNIAIGALYEKEGDYNKAEPFLQKALKLATNIGAKAYIREAYRVMMLICGEQRQFERAYETQKKYIELDHEINNAATAHQIAQISTQHEMELKEKEAELERKKNIELQKAYDLVEAEQKRSDGLLLNILPAHVAEELKEKGYSEPRSFDLVTVLFTDIKGFTKLSEQMTAKELVQLIDECFRAYDRIIARYPIEKIKVIGDAYMCAGGLPVANTSNPVDMVNAALDIQAFMKEFASAKQQQGLPHFEVRLGVHSGPVVAGIIGERKFAYDIWGDTVNVASRMESSGEAGKVNISGRTHDLVKHAFQCTHRGKMEAKNKGHMDMYFVEGRLVQAPSAMTVI